MALSILDGNQSATTLSTILSSGQHITAHTVVSLGTQAITDMRGAVSGSVVSISNFPATQTIAGTVTANPTGTQTIAGTVTANGGDFSSSNTAQPTSKIQIGFQGIGGDFTAVNEDGYPFPVNVFIDGTRVQSSNPIPISGTVTVGNTVNFLSGSDNDANLIENIASAMSQNNILGITNAIPAGTNRIGVVTIGGGTVTIGGGTAQIGTVTANNTNLNRLVQDGEFTDTFGVPIIYARVAGGALDYWKEVSQISGLPVTNQLTTGSDVIPFTVAGTVTIGSLPALVAGTAQIGSVTASISNSLTIGSLPAISGTVTANSSNGSLTTRFGSVTTANTAFATSAVTNASRKYLLIQNVTTASNVITVGIGFTPTTTQGIQLFAGAGLTFEGSYIPTGAVNLLSSVTASCYTILEA